MIEQSIVKVGMADLNIAAQGETLKTVGLGSCVGLTLYDPIVKIGGMAHVMLPSSEIARESNFNIAKYADTALPQLIERMERAGAKKERFTAKMAGGAQMFAFAGGGDSLRIGPRNVETCTAILLKYRIPLLAEDTGGNFGRTIEFNTFNGVLSIRSVQFGVKEL